MGIVIRANFLKQTQRGIGNMAKLRGKDKVHKVMGEFKRGTLRSGSKHGPKVKNRKQAIAIAMSESGMSRKNPSPPYGSTKGTAHRYSALGIQGVGEAS